MSEALHHAAAEFEYRFIIIAGSRRTQRPSHVRVAIVVVLPRQTLCGVPFAEPRCLGCLAAFLPGLRSQSQGETGRNGRSSEGSVAAMPPTCSSGRPDTLPPAPECCGSPPSPEARAPVAGTSRPSSGLAA